MAKIRRTSEEIQKIGEMDLPTDMALHRFRELIILLESAPVDAQVAPPEEEGEVPSIQEIFIFGLEVQTNGKTHKAISYTPYADALMRSVYKLGKLESVPEPNMQDLIVGQFAVFTLGVGQPEQLKVVGPISDKGLQTLSHERVFREFTNLISPIVALPLSTVKDPIMVGKIDNFDLITTFSMPRTVSEYLHDHTSGLYVRIYESVLKTLEKKDAHISEFERAISRLALVKAKKSIADTLAQLKM